MVIAVRECSVSHITHIRLAGGFKSVVSYKCSKEERYKSSSHYRKVATMNTAPIEKRAIDPMTFRLSFKHISGINYEDLEYLATDKSTLYIEPHFEDYEDDGLPMFDFVMEDGDTQDVISPNDPLELSQEIEAYIDDLNTTQRENHQYLMDEGYFGADPEFTADEDGWVWVTIKSVINRSEFRF